MKEFLIAVAVTAVLGGVLALSFAGEHEGRQAGYALAATPEPPSASATAFPITTPAASKAGGGGAPGGPASPGQALATRLGCLACHSVSGASGVGPSWKGRYQAPVALADGSTVTADEAYLRESVVSPNAKVVKGFNPSIMPQNFGQTLSADEISQLVEYIKTLK